jgi:hypothetical protein
MVQVQKRGDYWLLREMYESPCRIQIRPQLRLHWLTSGRAPRCSISRQYNNTVTRAITVWHVGGYIQRTDTKLEPDGVHPSRPIPRGTLVTFKFLIYEVSSYDIRTQDTACNPVVLLWNELRNPNSDEAFWPFLGGPRGGHEDSSSDSIILDSQMAIMTTPPRMLNSVPSVLPEQLLPRPVPHMS